MKTAVEWYNQQIVDRQNGNGDSRSRDEIFNQAKEMEKEQRKKDFRAGWHGNKHKDWNCEFYLQGHLTNQFKKQEQ